jgi:integrase
MNQKRGKEAETRWLVFRRNRDGRLRPRWYANVTLPKTKKRKTFALCSFEGVPPKSELVRDQGDAAFELSRQKALAMLDDILSGARTEADKIATVEKVLAYKYQIKIDSPPLSRLVDAWDQFPRRRKPSQLHRENCRRILARFVSYMAEQSPDIKDLAEVKADHVRGFMEAEESRGITARTWNETLSVLRGAFVRLDPNAGAYRDYLRLTLAKDEATIHREPYSLEEIRGILEAARPADPLIFRLVVTAFSAGMRRGDLCRLRWRDVDLEGGFVAVKTTKTGEKIEFPILPMLRGVLDDARHESDGKPESFIFPEAEKLYRQAPEMLDRKLKRVLALAGFVDEVPAKDDRPTLPFLPPEELKRRAAKIIGAMKTEKAGRRTEEIFTRYMDGETVPQIAAAAGISKGIVSLRLNELETQIGAAIIRRNPRPGEVRGVILAPKTEDGGPRLKRASLRGWHSFRTSFITAALSAGIPMELVRRISGHSTVDVVLKHYFKPGRAQMAAAVASALPMLAEGGAKTRDEQIAEIAAKMTPKTMTRDCARIIEILGITPPKMAKDKERKTKTPGRRKR